MTIADFTASDFNSIVLLIVTIINAYTAIKIKKTSTDVLKIELATNSMKDALIISTAKASHAEGVAKGRAEKEEEQKEK